MHFRLTEIQVQLARLRSDQCGYARIIHWICFYIDVCTGKYAKQASSVGEVQLQGRPNN